ncbi:MAG: DUF3298 domain-containing protein [Ignavibacteriae bacterium]|nr:DUF3298 domain-containing protein [Ignavibacteriota bacterium]
MKITLALILVFIASAVFAQEYKMITKEIKDSSEAGKYWYSAKYPQVDGMPNKQIQSAINESIFKTVDKCLGDFRKDMSEWEVPYELTEVNSFMDINYESFVLNEDLFSFSFEVYTYYAGAAHPNSYTISHNWNMKNGKFLTFSGLFKKNSGYLEKISKFCIENLKLQAKMSDYEMIDDMLQSGAGPNDSNFMNFNFFQKGMLITFDRYQVAPYAAGTQYVLIPYIAFYEMLTEDCFLNKFNY